VVSFTAEEDELNSETEELDVDLLLLNMPHDCELKATAMTTRYRDIAFIKPI